MKAVAVIAAVVGACFAPVAHAASTWTVDAGVGARVRPAHIGSSHYLVDAAPILEASLGDDLSFSLDDGAKWRAFRYGPVRAGPIVEYRQSFTDQLPAGAFRMHDAVEVGGFTEVMTPVGVAEARLRRAVNAYDGWSGDLSFSTGRPVKRKLFLGGQMRLSWADANFTRETFGLRPPVASGLNPPKSLDDDYITAGAELDAARELSKRARLVLELSADRIVGAPQASPLVASRNIFTATLGLTWRWSASKGHVS